MYNLHERNFIFGFYFGSDANKSVIFDQSYFNFQLFQVSVRSNNIGSYGKVYDYQPLSLDSCGFKFGKYISTELSNALGVSSMLCPTNSSLFIGGNYFSTNYNYIQILITKCKSQPYCKSDADINTAMKSIIFGIASTDYFFDADDYSNQWILTILKIN